MPKVHQAKFIHSISNYDSAAKYTSHQTISKVTLSELTFKVSTTIITSQKNVSSCCRLIKDFI